MEYTALYRKLRPKVFSEVCGQEHITKTLKNQLISHRVSHAYLFCGTRGTGKTSTAKIFARAINCQNPKDGEPCGECAMCLAAAEDRSFNIFEIDAASNNGVDNIRELRDEVNYPPAVGEYKVYIIDEVHMLSLAAFNALLKTLEEPPAHVVFILATTDPQKVPVTILSRCQRFDFKRIGAETISKTLSGYMKTEGIKITDEAVGAISGVCDGAMRDALSILDRCISFYYGEEITKDKVLEVIGSADKALFFDFTDALSRFDTFKALSLINRIFEDGKDLNRFTAELIVHLRNVLLAKQPGGFKTAPDYSEENTERLIKQAAGMETERLIDLISSFSELLNRMKYSDNIRITLEVFTVKITSPLSDDDSSLVSRIESLERLAAENITFGFAENISQNTINNINNREKVQETAPVAAKPVKEKALPEDIKAAIDNFSALKKGFKSSPESVFIEKTEAGYLKGEKLCLVCPSPALYDFWAERLDIVKEAMLEVFGKEFEAEPILKEDYDARCIALFGQKDVKKDPKGISELDTGELKKKIHFDNIEIYE
ncbi:MAG: DNA polymerase III subunit gamma/tau [Clostridiales bacterium]|nr:DNA polymerase III subunit gamma/tau [Clostridiales bacterium]